MSTSSTHYPATSGLLCDGPCTVSAWLRAHGERVEGDVTIARIGFGQSNTTSTTVTAADGRRWVLREPRSRRMGQTCRGRRVRRQIPGRT
ncbi:MAG TPA: hypothetical protein VGC05_08450 [Mycobacterium sp.]